MTARLPILTGIALTIATSHFRPSQAHADIVPIFSGSADVSPTNLGGTATVASTASTPVSGTNVLPATLSFEGIAAPDVRSSYAVVLGHILLSATATSPGNVNEWHETSGSALGAWTDTFLLSSVDPTLSGTTVQITPVISISGLPATTYDYGPLGSAFYVNWSVTLNSDTGLMYDAEQSPTGNMNGSPPTFESIQRTATVGESMTLQLSAHLWSVAQGGGDGLTLEPVSSYASLEASLLGFKFTDPLGTTLQNIVLTDSLGAVWGTAAIPTPEPISLAFFSPLAVALLRGRRKQH